ncbi:MAG: GvpL/GvpF family gas vesicle protein [Candidatus Schekmanbacteria bacterium]|nr:GvpL/GvpF family gas vesicle protein [Candidatus Schekmanbacteria bacterium]
MAGMSELLYVYGFTPPGPLLVAMQVSHGGVDGSGPLGAIEHAGVAALASAVPASVFGAEALQERLLDARWVVTQAERHNEVLQQALACGSVVPCRFATLFSGEAALRQALEHCGAALTAAFARLDGRVEWAVRAFLDARPTPPPPSPPGGPSGDAGNAARRGRTYLLGKVADRQAQRSAAAQATVRAEAIVAAVADAADEVVALPVRALPGETPGKPFLNLACLVRRDRQEAFSAAMTHQAAAESAHGVALTVTGPWPPFTFVSEAFSDHADGAES